MYLCGGMDKTRLIVSLLSLLCLAACTPRSVREAQDVVAQADSSWQAGQPYADSALLAQSYRTLEHWQWVYPDDYVHACYHYGRLLREKENPVAAMECFIRATHSRSRDYHILGRVYSNMGSICHLANEFPLSYDMFEQSANMFLRGGDSLLYYYGLNNMAYEMAELGEKQQTMVLLDKIAVECEDMDALSWSNIIKAELYKNIKQYDSALYYANTLKHNIYFESTKQIIKMQSYSMMSLKDSAVYCARLVLSISNDLFDRNNALYVLTNEDETQDKGEIRRNASERSDIQKILETRQGKLSQATQLLEQDIKRKPDLRWLYAVLATIFIFCVSLFVYIRKKQNQHKLLSQQVNDLNEINNSVKEQHEHIKQEYTEYKDSLLAQIEQNYAVLTQSPEMFQDIHWKDFNAMSKIINDNFGMLVAKLQGIYHLSEKEIRLCILVLLEISSSKQLAEMLYYGESGIRNFKNRTAKKLGTNSVEMRKALLYLAINEYSNA